MTATTCFMEFIFLTEREKPINESDVDSDGEIDSESTGIGNSINNKVWGHLEDRWATIIFFFFNSFPAIFEVPLYLIIDRISDSCGEQSEDECFRNVNKFVEIEYKMEYN
jgi:hypothetical protein